MTYLVQTPLTQATLTRHSTHGTWIARHYDRISGELLHIGVGRTSIDAVCDAMRAGMPESMGDALLVAAGRIVPTETDDTIYGNRCPDHPAGTCNY